MSNSVIKEVKSYEINKKNICYDSVVQYKRKEDERWTRGLVKFVDKNSIKIMRSVGTQESFSATQIALGQILIDVEIM